MSLNIQEIESSIAFGNFTNEQLDSIQHALKYARSELSKKNKRSFRPGDQVKFTSARNGVTYQGQIKRIKLKYILVNTQRGLFNVPANMLEAA